MKFFHTLTTPSTSPRRKQGLFRNDVAKALARAAGWWSFVFILGGLPIAAEDLPADATASTSNAAEKFEMPDIPGQWWIRGRGGNDIGSGTAEIVPGKPGDFELRVVRDVYRMRWLASLRVFEMERVGLREIDDDLGLADTKPLHFARMDGDLIHLLRVSDQDQLERVLEQWDERNGPRDDYRQAVFNVLQRADKEMPDISGVWSDSGSDPRSLARKLFLWRDPEKDSRFFLFQDHRTMWLIWDPAQGIFRPDDFWGNSPFVLLLSPDHKKITQITFRSDDAKTWKAVLEGTAVSSVRNHVSRDYYKYLGPHGTVESSTLVLSETENGLAAYSKTLGRWDRIETPRPKNGSPRILHITLSEGFVGGVIDDLLLGYGSEFGRWGRMTIPPEYVGKVAPVLGLDLLSAQVGDTLYAFSPQTGQWTSPDGKVVSKPESSSDQSGSINVRVIPIKHADLMETVKKLISYYQTSASFAVDSKSNSITISGSDPELLEKIEKSIQEYDAKQGKDKAIQRAVREYEEEAKEGTIEESPESNGYRINSTTPAAQHLAAEIARHEAEAVELAKQIRNRSLNVGDKHPEQVEARRKLQNALAAALDLKFQLEQLQVQELQSRLSRLEQQIGQRKAQRQKIIDRRAQELIEGDATRWDSGEGPLVAPQRRAAVSPVTGVPIGLPGAPVIPPPDSEKAELTPREQYFQDFIASKNLEIVRLELSGPDGMSLQIGYRGRHKLPCTFNVTNEFRSVLHFFPATGQAFSGKIEFSPRNPHTKFFWDDHVIPLTITDEDLDQVKANNIVTKVVYLNEEGIRDKTETIVSTRLDPGFDPVEDAKRRGAVLVVLRLAAGKEKLKTPQADLDSAADDSSTASPVDTMEGSASSVKPKLSNAEVLIPARRRATTSASRPTLAKQSPGTADVLDSKEFAPDLTTGLVDAQSAVADAKSDLDRLEQLAKKGVVTEQEVSQARRSYEAAVRRQEVLHEVYLSTLRDLELQIEAAKLEYEAAEKAFQRVVKVGDQISQSERTEYELRRNQAKLSLERLQNRYDLYKKAGEGLSTPPSPEKTTPSKETSPREPAAPPEAAASSTY